jgi:hypothetical protein
MELPSNTLFWLVGLLVLVGYVGTLIYLHSRGRAPDGEFHSGRLPGYSYTLGANVGLDTSVVALPEGDWYPTRLETLHAGERTRLILSLSIDRQPDNPDALLDFLQRLGREIRERSEADVVLLQARPTDDPESQWEYLLAPDGAGWWGRERVETALRSPLPDKAPELNAPPGDRHG